MPGVSRAVPVPAPRSRAGEAREAVIQPRPGVVAVAAWMMSRRSSGSPIGRGRGFMVLTHERRPIRATDRAYGDESQRMGGSEVKTSRDGAIPLPRLGKLKAPRPLLALSSGPDIILGGPGMTGGGSGPIGVLFGGGTLVGLDDADLVDRFVAGRGDEAAARAFEALVTRHGPMVLAVCRTALRDGHDAQDAFQATFLILARRARSIRRRDTVASWLFGVARRVALRARADAARRRARERRVAISERSESALAREPDDLAVLHEEVARLPTHYRAAVVLCDLEGLTYESAARELRCPPGTLATHLRRARERLRSRLTRRGVTAAIPPVAAGPTAPVPVRIALQALRQTPCGRATAAGVVSTSAATLAARTLMMMRLQAITTGLLGLALGSATLGVVALAATQAPAPAPTPRVNRQHRRQQEDPALGPANHEWPGGRADRRPPPRRSRPGRLAIPQWRPTHCPSVRPVQLRTPAGRRPVRLGVRIQDP